MKKSEQNMKKPVITKFEKHDFGIKSQEKYTAKLFFWQENYVFEGGGKCLCLDFTE